MLGWNNSPKCICARKWLVHLEDFGLLTSYLYHALYTTIVIVKHSAINRFDLLDEVHRSDINFYFAEMDLLIWIKTRKITMWKTCPRKSSISFWTYVTRERLLTSPSKIMMKWNNSLTSIDYRSDLFHMLSVGAGGKIVQKKRNKSIWSLMLMWL